MVPQGAHDKLQCIALQNKKIIGSDAKANSLYWRTSIKRFLIKIPLVSWKYYNSFYSINSNCSHTTWKIRGWSQVFRYFKILSRTHLNTDKEVMHVLQVPSNFQYVTGKWASSKAKVWTMLTFTYEEKKPLLSFLMQPQITFIQDLGTKSSLCALQSCYNPSLLTFSLPIILQVLLIHTYSINRGLISHLPLFPFLL